MRRAAACALSAAAAAPAAGCAPGAAGCLPGLRPFNVSVPEEVLDDLWRRLRGARWPDQLAPPCELGLA
eukprot:gene4557-10946_t